MLKQEADRLVKMQRYLRTLCDHYNETHEKEVLEDQGLYQQESSKP
jgi:hypothetical protein